MNRVKITPQWLAKATYREAFIEARAQPIGWFYLDTPSGEICVHITELRAALKYAERMCEGVVVEVEE